MLNSQVGVRKGDGRFFVGDSVVLVQYVMGNERVKAIGTVVAYSDQADMFGVEDGRGKFFATSKEEMVLLSEYTARRLRGEYGKF